MGSNSESVGLDYCGTIGCGNQVTPAQFYCEECLGVRTLLGKGFEDFINHPPHYTTHPSGVECIQVTEHMGFCLGNAIKYIWRCDTKGGVKDLKKAIWYIEREIQKREKE